MAVRFAFTLGVGLGITPHAAAQQAITGRVSNEGSGRPLSGVSLRLDGEQVAFTTNANGTFTIPDMAAGDHTLTVSLRGPQSTPGGPNALAGKVEVLPNDPTMDWEMAAQTEFGNRSQNQQAVAVSGPFVEDQSDFQPATLGASPAVGVDVNARVGGS